MSDFGGDKRDRTADLLNAIQALSQLSYTPIFDSLSDSFRIIAYYAEKSRGYFEFFQKNEVSKQKSQQSGRRLCDQGEGRPDAAAEGQGHG